MSLISPSTIFSHCRVFNFVLSCQPRVTKTSCFVYKVIRDLESIDHLCINPILYISDLSIRDSSRGVYKLVFY